MRVRRRTRVKSDTRRITCDAVTITNGVETSRWEESWSTFNYWSQIHDTVRNRKGFNPCGHTVLKGDPGKFPVDFYTQWQSGLPPREVETHTTVKEGPGWMIPEVALEALPKLPPSALHDPAMRAFKAFTDQFPEDVSIGNYLIELREGIAGMLPRLDDLKKLWANGLLSWEFGLRPFIDDTKKILGAYDRAMKRLKFLQDHNYKETVVHFSCKVPYDWEAALPLLSTFTESGEQWEIWHYARCRPSSYHCKFTAGAVILPKLLGLDNAIASLVAVMSTLGLNNPGAILWNAIPFSWLLEWFINLDHILDNLAVQVFPGTIEILDLWYSVKAETTLDVYRSRRAGSSQVVRSKSGEYKATQYMRTTGLPLKPDPDNWLEDGLSAKQLAILLALLHTRLG